MEPFYDFDIQWLIPREVEADPAIVDLLAEIGVNGTSRGNYIALFRDPQVIAMIERADPVLREYLKASGFGFIAYQSGAPAGRFPAVDAAARADVIARLKENLGRFDLDGAGLGGFDFDAFLKAITKAEPLPPGADPRRPRVAPVETLAPVEPEVLAMPIGLARLAGRNRVLPLMVVSLAVTLGAYWLIEHIQAAPAPF